MAKPDSAQSELRIVAGRWRGTKVRFTEADDLRPTGDRVRETLFNWLQMDVQDATFLDLFAGSGSLGFEAASRGAKMVCMVETHDPTVQQLRNQIAKFQADNISVWRGAALDYLQRFDYEFDFVFLDPPFHSDLLQPVLDHFLQGNNLQPHAKIYCEYALENEPVLADGWEFVRQKKAGAVGYGLIARTES